MDSLQFQPLKNNIDLDQSDFTKIFGDSYISGFLEGGEFNGLVSMKVLNNAKKTDIAVAAKVALTVGAGTFFLLFELVNYSKLTRNSGG